MNKFTIITARANSTRLKNKILKKIVYNYKSIDILIARAQKIDTKLILATSNDKSDDNLVEYVRKRYPIKIFRGDLNNKIKRWNQCFTKYKVDYACIIDGDDLAFDYNLYNKYIFSRNLKKYDIFKYCTGIVTGSFTYIFSKKVIRKLAMQTKKIKYLDVLDHLIKKNNFKIKNIYVSDKLKNHKIRLTLDYKEDLLFFKKLYTLLPIVEETKNIITFLLKKKNITSINFKLETQWKNNQKNEILRKWD